MRRTVIVMALAGAFLAGCTNDAGEEQGTPEPEASATDEDSLDGEPDADEQQDEDEQSEDR